MSRQRIADLEQTVLRQIERSRELREEIDRLRKRIKKLTKAAKGKTKPE